MTTIMHIHAMGMSCPVGLHWLTACAAMRAGIDCKQELDYLDDDGELLTGSVLSLLEHMPTPRARWVRLLAWSLRDALQPLSREQVMHLPVALALPADARGLVPESASVIAELNAIWDEDLGLDPRNVQIVCEQAYGGFRALAWAREHVAAQRACVVGAADSLIGVGPLAQLYRSKRLLTDKNPDGVIPGEASACVLLHAAREQAMAGIRGLGFGREVGLLDNDIPLRADGIVAATRAALAESGLEFHDLDFRVSDAAGESYHFKEQSLLSTRLLRQRKDSFPLELPADALGYTGAAAGLIGLVSAVESLVRGKAPGPRAIVYAGNDWGDRAAVIVEAVSTMRT